MPNDVSFFAINADDVPRARKFYQAVFQWGFEPWGPPGFYLIQTSKERAPDAMGGALQERRELAPGQKMIGFECTITVADIDQTIRAIEANGGRVAAPKYHIPTVGTVAYFFDTEGNVAGIIQRERQA
jgi:predicted enzyme related to lactoylglutathione lyase